MASPKHNIDPNRMRDLTIEEVKSCSMFAHLTDQEAVEVIESLKTLCQLAFIARQQEEKTNNFTCIKKRK